MGLPDVLVLGAGAIGMSIARGCAIRGMRVTVVTRDAPGAGASTTAAGMLEIHYPHPMPPDLPALCRYSAGLYPAFAESLRAGSGRSIGFEPSGSLVLARTGAELDDLRAQAPHLPGATLVTDPGRLPELEPGLGVALAGGLLLPDDHRVHSGDLCAALLDALERLGVRIARGVTVTGVTVAGGRVTGLATDAGPLGAGLTVLAPGAWAGTIAGLPFDLPVRPVKGQLVVLESAELPRRALQAGGVYLVPRPRERHLLIGATVEEAGFNVTPTAGAVAGLLADGAVVYPAITRARLAGVRTGLRPATPDGLPVLGEAAPGLLVAAGHFRKGILLAPGTAEIISRLAAGEPAPLPLGPFAPGRFARAAVGQR